MNYKKFKTLQSIDGFLAVMKMKTLQLVTKYE